MAIFKQKPVPPVPEILPLAEHPQHMRWASVRRALMAALTDRQREIDLAAIEAELRHPSGGSARGPRADAMRARAAKLRQALPAPPAPPVPADGLPPAIARALALLQGEKVAQEQDRGERLKQLRGEVADIEAALTAVTAQLEEFKAEQTHQAALAILPRHKKALAAIYEAAEAFSAAVQAEREIIVAIIGGGYDAAEHILQRPGFPAASRIGTLSEHESELSAFRRRLENQGVI